MPKPKAPVWLREAFRDGVDERLGMRRVPECWLAQHDPRRRPCSGRLERFHFIGRQRVENALDALLPAFDWSDGTWPLIRADLILLAAWDSRNGGIGCEGHHRRFDAHATPTLKISRDVLPGHVLDFVADWGLDGQVVDRFPFA